jgi:hypothetical protein
VPNTERVLPAPTSRLHVRLVIWALFVTAIVMSVAVVHAARSSTPRAAATWAIRSPGLLEVTGKPTIDVSTKPNGDLLISIETSTGRQTHRTNVTASGTASVRTFWRGDRVIVDLGDGRVLSIDPSSAVMSTVPKSFGWNDPAGVAVASKRDVPFDQRQRHPALFIEQNEISG